jgi:hypothetical protein
MAVKKLTQSSVLNDKKYQSLLAGNAYFQPNSFESIATVTVGAGGQSSVTFSSIPSTFTHLQIRGIARSTRSDQNGSFANINVGSGSVDTGSNYSWSFINGNGSSVGAVARSSQTAIEVDRWSTSLVTSGIYGSIIIDILDYASVNKNKSLRYVGGYDGNGNGESYVGQGTWFNSSTAIDKITLTEGSGNFAQYTTFALYGIKGA